MAAKGLETKSGACSLIAPRIASDWIGVGMPRIGETGETGETVDEGGALMTLYRYSEANSASATLNRKEDISGLQRDCIRV